MKKGKLYDNDIWFFYAEKQISLSLFKECLKTIIKLLDIYFCQEVSKQTV